LAIPEMPDTTVTDSLTEVEIQALDAARLESLIGSQRMEHYEQVADAAQAALSGHSVLNVNSTASGGGVAELLQTLLAYVRGAGVDARWLVIHGDPDFFAITKRIHNRLYGTPGDGGPLGDAEREHYERVLRKNAEELQTLVRPGDVVLIHDPQPAGLLQAVSAAGARAVWRCHVGCDRPNRWTEHAWQFLRPYLEYADDYVFSRAAFAPPWVDRDRLHAIPPSIDPFSAKNEPIRPCPSPAAMARRDGSIATWTSCRAVPPLLSMRRSWCRSHAGTGSRTWRA
jgi:trehalose synthase